MGADAAGTALLCALSLYFSGSRASKRWQQAGRIAALLAIVLLIGSRVFIVWGIGSFLPGGCGAANQALSPESTAAFLLVAVSSLLMGSGRRLAVRAADMAIFALFLLVLILVSSYLFGALRVFGLSAGFAEPQTVLCLALLAEAAVLRRFDAGVFSILYGRGAGSRLARALVPVFLVIQFVREAGRARLDRAHLLPPQYAMAILASCATMVSLIVLLLLAWRINRMEAENQDLSLRDALTGLYNLRGFSLLAEQAVRLAQRSQMPFSVLYVDVDNLKQTNDSLGHEAGSSLIAETALLLKATFRETDVMGRIGGDEFAVAGHLSHVAISIAAERLKAACAARGADAKRQPPLSFSVGFATAQEHARQTLKELLTAADRAMYEEKRSKKTGQG